METTYRPLTLKDAADSRMNDFPTDREFENTATGTIWRMDEILDFHLNHAAYPISVGSILRLAAAMPAERIPVEGAEYRRLR